MCNQICLKQPAKRHGKWLLNVGGCIMQVCLQLKWTVWDYNIVIGGRFIEVLLLTQVLLYTYQQNFISMPVNMEKWQNTTMCIIGWHKMPKLEKVLLQDFLYPQIRGRWPPIPKISILTSPPAPPHTHRFVMLAVLFLLTKGAHAPHLGNPKSCQTHFDKISGPARPLLSQIALNLVLPISTQCLFINKPWLPKLSRLRNQPLYSPRTETSFALLMQH